MCGIFNNQQNNNEEKPCAFTPSTISNKIFVVPVLQYKKNAGESLPLIELPVELLMSTMIYKINLERKSPEVTLTSTGFAFHAGNVYLN